MKASASLAPAARSGPCILPLALDGLQAVPALLKAEMSIKAYGQARWV